MVKRDPDEREIAISQEFLSENRKLLKVSVKPQIKARPHISAMLAKAYWIVDQSLDIYANKLMAGGRLDAQEVNTFARLSEVLVKMTKEEREEEKRADPKELSDDELLTQAEQAKKALTGGDYDS